MKAQKRSPGSIITWAHRTDRGELEITVAVIGVQGTTNLPWDHNEIRGGHFAAAKVIAKQRGFDDVIEVGTLRRGQGFIYHPVLHNERNNHEEA